MNLARWVFLIAGIFGLLLVAFLIYATFTNEQTLVPGPDEMGLFFSAFVIQYAFLQIFYIIIGRVPERSRGMMILAFFSVAISALNPTWLYWYGYLPWLFIGAVNLTLAILFLVSFRLVGRETNRSAA